MAEQVQGIFAQWRYQEDNREVACSKLVAGCNQTPT